MLVLIMLLILAAVGVWCSPIPVHPPKKRKARAPKMVPVKSRPRFETVEELLAYLNARVEQESKD